MLNGGVPLHHVLCSFEEAAKSAGAVFNVIKQPVSPDEVRLVWGR